MKKILVIKLILVLLTITQFEIVLASTINEVSIFPISGQVGTKFKLSVKLNSVLTSGNKVKVNYGSGLLAMTGSKQDYILTISPKVVSDYSYQVGIYDSKNVLIGENVKGNFTVKPLNHAPKISIKNTLKSTINQGETYSLQLNANDSDNNLTAINIDWGDGTNDLQNAANNTKVIFNHIYNVSGTLSWKANAIDSENLTSTILSKKILIKKLNNQIKVPSIVSTEATSVEIGTPTNFKAALSDSLPVNYSVLLNYGNKNIVMSCSGNACSSIQNSTTVGLQNYTIGIYDNNNKLVSDIVKGSFEVKNLVQIKVPIKKDGYSKISNSGNIIDDSAVIGSGNNDWGCTKDNKTGLIWEVKTTDGSIRDMKKKYTNYNSTYTKGSILGKFGDITNSDGYMNAVNNKSLCGKKDWRLPTGDELIGLVYCSDSVYANIPSLSLVSNNIFVCPNNDYNLNKNSKSTKSPVINTDYFHESDWGNPVRFWTSTPFGNNTSFVWTVDFSFGSVAKIDITKESYYIRLVSGNNVENQTIINVEPLNGTGKLNDTGIKKCSDGAHTDLRECPIKDFPNQDAESGRDVLFKNDSDGLAGFNFTKIDSSGNKLVSSSKKWSCVEDNVTGLMWENKTTDGGLHDKKYTYTWFDPDSSKNGGNIGYEGGGACIGSKCDTLNYVKAVNLKGFCGYNDWRMPTAQELLSIISYTSIYPLPMLDLNYFTNNLTNESYWSSTSNINCSDQLGCSSSDSALLVNYDLYLIGSDDKGSSKKHAVRLVRTSSSIYQPINSDTPSNIPSITDITATPVSILQGGLINFSAILSDALPANYKVKISYADDLVSNLIQMNPVIDDNKKFIFSQNINKLGMQLFNIGIYDSNINLVSNSMTGNFEVIQLNNAPTLNVLSSNESTLSLGFYSIQLYGNDVDGNLSYIVVDWGDGISNLQYSKNNESMQFSHNYAYPGTYKMVATAYDSNPYNSTELRSNVETKDIIVPASNSPIILPTTTGYSKISNSGAILPDSAVLGEKPSDWACTQDNKTGFIWEIKTQDGGLRDNRNTYSWYKPAIKSNTNINTGFVDINYLTALHDAGEQNLGKCSGSNCDTSSYVSAVNNDGLCNGKNWQLPTLPQLNSLIFCSDNIYNKQLDMSKDNNANYAVCLSNYKKIINGSIGVNERTNINTTVPTINTSYFPDFNDNNRLFRSATQYRYSSETSTNAWIVDFYDSFNYSPPKGNSLAVRLMHCPVGKSFNSIATACIMNQPN